ncbi:MAG: XdhC family protein [Gammaproteobacteria bacterium]|jgi:xanthine dehydrogenase accessory factor
MTQQADDIAVLSAAAAWLREGRRVALGMVLRTWGSSPRPPGSLLAMNDSGNYCGSLSGGCVEETLVARYADGDIAGPQPTRIDFGVDRQEASRMGLPCGGRLEVLVEELGDAQQTEALLERLARGELVARTLDCVTGRVSLQAGRDGPELAICDDRVTKTFGPAWQLLLIGDGQLARHLASMASQLDYRVTICDPRDLYKTPMPDGIAMTDTMPDDAVRNISDQARTAIVTLAHDPKQDDLGLSAALESGAFYIGALGSRQSAQARNRRLESLGYSRADIARIHGPAGLSIGSKRPAEIALSILAQITAIRNGITGANG